MLLLSLLALQTLFCHVFIVKIFFLCVRVIIPTGQADLIHGFLSNYLIGFVQQLGDVPSHPVFLLSNHINAPGAALVA